MMVSGTKQICLKSHHSLIILKVSTMTFVLSVEEIWSLLDVKLVKIAIMLSA